MEESSFNPQIGGQVVNIARHIKTLPETCAIHTDTHLLQLRDMPAFCPKCAKEKRDAEWQERVKKESERMYHRHHIEALKLYSIFDDEDVLEQTFDNYRAAEETESYENWMQARRLGAKFLDPEFKSNVIFTGNPGTGKTHLAMAIANAVNAHADPEMMVIFMSVNEAVRQVKNSFNFRESRFTEEYVTSLAGKADLLVLDDLGSESVMTSGADRYAKREASDWVQQFLFGILNKRKGRTIITTNLSSEQLSEAYNSKLISRMYRGTKESGGVIRFTDRTNDKRLEM